MNDNEKYSDLLRRYELLMADWMRRVEDVRARPMDLQFYSMGAVFSRNGTLRMTAKSVQGDTTLWELTTEPGDTQVRITFPDKTTYLV